MKNTIYKISKEKHSDINTTEHKETNHQQVVLETGLYGDKLADNKDIISCCCCCGVCEEEYSSMCDYNNTLSDLPATPMNVTVLGIFTTSVILQWSVVCQRGTDSFEVHVDPLQSDWMSENALVSFVVTRINGETRQYIVRGLLPETLYSVFMVTVSDSGVSNNSVIINFRTMQATVTVIPNIEVRPIEAVLVFCILGAWVITIVWFLKKWSTLRIVKPSEYQYQRKQPKNLHTIKVVNTENDSVIYRNYGQDHQRTLQARMKRLDRMHTMPNLNVKINDFPDEASIQKLSQSKKSHSVDDCPSAVAKSLGIVNDEAMLKPYTDDIIPKTPGLFKPNSLNKGEDVSKGQIWEKSWNETGAMGGNAVVAFSSATMNSNASPRLETFPEESYQGEEISEASTTV